MRIRLQKHAVVIEIAETSKYFSRLCANVMNGYEAFWRGDKLVVPSKKEDAIKRENFLKTVYFMCVQTVKYQNPVFFKNLIKACDKPIELKVKGRMAKRENHSPLRGYYALLNAKEEESLQVIRKRYLQLAKIYHPDRVADRDSITQQRYTKKFQQIQEAYEMLRLKKAA